VNKRPQDLSRDDVPEEAFPLVSGGGYEIRTREGVNPTRFPTGWTGVLRCSYMAMTSRSALVGTPADGSERGRTETIRGQGCTEFLGIVRAANPDSPAGVSSRNQTAVEASFVSSAASLPTRCVGEPGDRVGRDGEQRRCQKCWG
jgi:hypothetical protein